MNGNEKEEFIAEQCPLHILVYICNFVTDVGTFKLVSKKCSSAALQLNLLNTYKLSFNSPECINLYLDPMFRCLQDHSPSKCSVTSVSEQCNKAVDQWTDVCMNPRQRSKKTKKGVRDFVHENCKLFMKTHQTNWSYLPQE